MPTLLSNGSLETVNHQALDQRYQRHSYALLLGQSIGKSQHRLWTDLHMNKYILSLMKPVKVTWAEIPGLCDPPDL